MALPTFSCIVNHWWHEVLDKVQNSVVFIDEPAAECLHWYGGLAKLLKAGAVDVKELSSFEHGNQTQKKTTFVLTQPLSGITYDRIRDIIQASYFEHCILITSVHMAVQSWISGSEEKDELEMKKIIEGRLLRMMGNVNYYAKVIYIPMFCVNICPILFVTPPFRNVFPLMNHDLKTLKEKTPSSDLSKPNRRKIESLEDLDFSLLAKEMQMQIQHLAHCFNSLLEQLNAKEDIYSIGHFSRIIATTLDSLPAARTRKKTGVNKISVVFVDRTLDLVGPTSHGMDTLMDRILNLLPKLPGHCNDVAVDMTSLVSSERNPIPNSKIILPGCLAHGQDSGASVILNSLVVNKNKDSLLSIRSQLWKAVTEEKLALNTSVKVGRVTASTLENQVNLFKNKTGLLYNHCGIIQQAMATIQTLNHPRNSYLDQLYGIEKGLLQCLTEGSGCTTLIAQILQLIKTRKERSIIIEDVIILLIHIYSLSGSDIIISEEELAKLQVAVTTALIEDSDCLSSAMKDFIGTELDELSIPTAVRDLFVKLEDIAQARSDLKMYKSLIDNHNPMQPTVYRSLLKQMLDDIFHPSRPDIPDIEFRSTSFKERLKTSFSLFVNVNKPRPSDSQMIILYIVGGITATEVKQIRDTIISYKPNLQIAVGSTSLITSTEILNRLLSGVNNTSKDIHR